LPADGMVTLMDIFAIKQAGHFGAGAYAAGVETLVDEEGTAQVIYDAATGELTLQNEDGVEAILLESAAGLFVGEADETLASFVELTPEVFGAVSFDGALPMGSLGMVLPAGLDEATLTGDLTILGSAELVYQAVPEPGTLALLAMSLVGLLVWRRRAV